MHSGSDIVRFILSSDSSRRTLSFSLIASSLVADSCGTDALFGTASSGMTGARVTGGADIVN